MTTTANETLQRGDTWTHFSVKVRSLSWTELTPLPSHSDQTPKRVNGENQKAIELVGKRKTAAEVTLTIAMWPISDTVLGLATKTLILFGDIFRCTIFNHSKLSATCSPGIMKQYFENSYHGDETAHESDV